MGLVAYPGHGICKSLHTLTHTTTRKAIAAARQAEGQYLVANMKHGDEDASAVLRAFDQLTTR